MEAKLQNTKVSTKTETKTETDGTVIVTVTTTTIEKYSGYFVEMNFLLIARQFQASK